jgi:hypothetical protein
MRGIFKLVAIGVLGVTLQACDDGGDRRALGRFTGTWRAVSGTQTTVCPGFAPSTAPITPNVVWTEGLTSDLVQTHSDGLCVINADVTGDTASGQGPPCIVTESDGTTLTLTVSGYTFVLSADGQTASESGTASLLLNSGGASVNCTITLNAVYQKLSR